MPNEHFVPVHAEFANAAERVDWARRNDATVRSIAQRGARFEAETLRLFCVGHVLRLILSEAASQSDKPGRELKLMLLDAKKAHLHAMAEREIYVELPPERARPGSCCLLRRCLYGTRDAPRLW